VPRSGLRRDGPIAEPTTKFVNSNETAPLGDWLLVELADKRMIKKKDCKLKKNTGKVVVNDAGANNPYAGYPVSRANPLGAALLVAQNQTRSTLDPASLNPGSGIL
jgi:hypothetical protein